MKKMPQMKEKVPEETLNGFFSSAPSVTSADRLLNNRLRGFLWESLRVSLPKRGFACP
jgi:hypothetical protein